MTQSDRKLVTQYSGISSCSKDLIYWAIVKEETSSSESGLHFGHYIVRCNLDIVAHYHAAQVSVILAHTIQLEGGLADFQSCWRKHLASHWSANYEQSC